VLIAKLLRTNDLKRFGHFTILNNKLECSLLFGITTLVGALTFRQISDSSRSVQRVPKHSSLSQKSFVSHGPVLNFTLSHKDVKGLIDETMIGRIAKGQLTIGQLTIGQLTIGQLTIGQLTIGQMAIGQMTIVK
jgi:hypothetical protein